MVSGIVTNVSDKGYGFIRSPETQSDVFFHASGCVGPFHEIAKGDSVEFEIKTSPRGFLGVGVIRKECVTP